MNRTITTVLSLAILVVGFLSVSQPLVPRQNPVWRQASLPVVARVLTRLLPSTVAAHLTQWWHLSESIFRHAQHDSVTLYTSLLEDIRLSLATKFPNDYAICAGSNALNGAVYTSDPLKPLASCMLIREGVIFLVGSQDDVESYWAEHYPGRVLSLFKSEDAVIVPGLTDAHAHTLQWGYMSQLPLSSSRSIAEIVGKLEDFVRLNPDAKTDKNRWIRGLGWDQTKFIEKRWPTAADFASSPLLADRFIALERVDVHATWVSHAVIDLLPNPLPISDDEIEERGGKVLRNEDGTLSGVFVDNAQSLLPIPPVSPAQKIEWFTIAANGALSVGLTGIHDAFVDRADVDIYMKLAEEGSLPLRMYLMGTLPAGPAPIAQPSAVNGLNSTEQWPYLPRLNGYGTQGHLTLRSIKLFADGALGSFGAALLEPYSDDPSTSGLLLTPPETLRAQAVALYDRGWQVNTHAIGDRANKVVLDIYEEILNKPDSKLMQLSSQAVAKRWRPRIEHAQIMTAEDLERIGKLGVIPSVQPTHATSDMGYAESRLGPERMEGAYAYATLLHNTQDGVMPLGSDFPVENINPLLGFYAAISRLDVSSSSPNGSNGWYPEQRLSREEALRGMTSSAAYASFAEDSHGMLRAGLKADFVLLDHDIMKVPVEEILKTKVIATIVDGQIAFGAV